MLRTVAALGVSLLAAAATSGEAPSPGAGPLLHLDAEIHDGRWVPVSIARTFEGREVRRFPGISDASLSPRGDELAAVGEQLVIVAMDGVRRATIQAPEFGSRDERFFPTQPAWSADGRRIAAITVVPGETVAGNAWAIIVLDAGTGRPVARVPISLDTAAGCPYCMAFVNKFRWSPDGRRVLLSWGNTVVADPETQQVRVVSSAWSSADWCDDGNTVCFFEVDRTGEADPTARRVRLLGLFALDLRSGERSVLLDGEAIAESGLERSHFVHVPLMNTSPGTRQLIVNSLAEDGGTVLRFYDLAKRVRPRLGIPDRITRVAATIPQVAWSPSGDSIAAVAQADGAYRLLRFDLGTAQWTTLAELSWPPDTSPDIFAGKVLSWAN